jgi:tetratricopeptide (TPR) repeat protein
VNDVEELLKKGNDLRDLGKYEEAVASYNRAIEIDPSFQEAWFSRGDVFSHLKLYKLAISSYDKALEIDHNDYMTWFLRGNTLNRSEQYEEAISSFDRAIEIEPDFHDALLSKGNILGILGQHEEAITNYDLVIDLKSDCHEAFSFKGLSLNHLGRYRDAINSCIESIRIKIDYSLAWHNKGIALEKLGQYDKAIANYDRAISISPCMHDFWCSKGILVCILKGYQAEIKLYKKAFEYIHFDTNSEGWNFLQREIGRIYYEEGNNQLLKYRKNPQPYYNQALTHYNNALQTLTCEEFTKLRLETLIDIAKVYLAQHNTPAARECQIEALDILRDLLNAQPTFEGKKSLQIEFVTLSQLDVDLFIASGDNINAIVAAELDKNDRLTWLLSALAETTISPNYAEIQQLLATTDASAQTGIVYWHLSPDNLTTFILTANDSQPLVWESDRRSQAQQLAKWIKEWDTQYRDYGSKKAVSQNDEAAARVKEKHPWRQNLPDALARLRQILEIDRICAQLPANLTQLILIPHGDLHRFPIHTCFLNSAKLPNLQGLTMTQKWMQTVTWQNLADWLTQLSHLQNLKRGIVKEIKAHITNILVDGEEGTIMLNRPTKYSHHYHWAAFTLTGRG